MSDGGAQPEERRLVCARFHDNNPDWKLVKYVTS